MLHANPPIRSLPLWLLPLLLIGLLDPCHCEICTAALRKLHSGRDPTIILGGAAGATLAGFGLEGLHAAWVLTAFGLEELEAAVR